LAPTTEGAKALLKQASSVAGANGLEEFVAPSRGYFSESWLLCLPADENRLRCPMTNLKEVPLSDTSNLRGIVVEQGNQPKVMLSFSSGSDGQQPTPPNRAAPGLTITAKGDRLTEQYESGARFADIAVLFDADNHRVLAGPAPLIRSTFTRLMFLDPGYSHLYKLDDDRQGYDNERVKTWKITWDPQ